MKNYKSFKIFLPLLSHFFHFFTAESFYKSELSSLLQSIILYLGSTRVPGHAFLAWQNSWQMVVYCTIWQQLVILSARSWAAPARATGAVQKMQVVRSVHRVQNNICRVTLLKPARNGPPCWASPLAFCLIGHPQQTPITPFYSLSADYSKPYSDNFGIFQRR